MSTETDRVGVAHLYNSLTEQRICVEVLKEKVSTLTVRLEEATMNIKTLQAFQNKVLGYALCASMLSGYIFKHLF